MPSKRSVNKKLPLPEDPPSDEDSDQDPPSDEDDSESPKPEQDEDDSESPKPEQDEDDSESDSSSEGGSDDDREDPTVELNDGVINVTYYDSSDEESDDFDEEEPEPDSDFDDGDEVDSSNIDDETEEKFSFLTERLEEVAYVIYTGKNSFRINFQNKKGIKLVPKKEECDFDIDDDGLPIMVDGGENYILPYLVELCKRRSDLKPFQITTNCSKRRYNF